MSGKKTKIKRYLFENNIQQRQLADGTKIAEGNISLFCNGYTGITIRSIKKICTFLKCTPNDILPFEEWLGDDYKPAAIKQPKK